MSASSGHQHGPAKPSDPPGLRRVLWVALAGNAGMCALELAGGLHAGSLALWADAIDFFADAMAYAITLAVLGASLSARMRAARLKALVMAVLGLVVLLRATWQLLFGGATPHVPTMGGIAVLALGVNLGVAWLLYAFREGDANLKSVWLCSRNDAIGNVVVIAAAGLVWVTTSPWPDLAVAAIMGGLFLNSSFLILRQAWAEWQTGEDRGALESHGHAH